MYCFTFKQATLIHLHNKTRLLEIGMWWLGISTWKQSQPQSKQQEAGSKQEVRWKQKAWNMLEGMDLKWSAEFRQLSNADQSRLSNSDESRLSNAELWQFSNIGHRYCSTLPLFAPSQKSIYSRPFGSDFSFPSHVLLYFYASNIDSSSQQDKISTSNTPLLLPRYIKKPNLVDLVVTSQHAMAHLPCHSFCKLAKSTIVSSSQLLPTGTKIGLQWGIAAGPESIDAVWPSPQIIRSDRRAAFLETLKSGCLLYSPASATKRQPDLRGLAISLKQANWVFA